MHVTIGMQLESSCCLAREECGCVEWTAVVDIVVRYVLERAGWKPVVAIPALLRGVST